MSGGAEALAAADGQRAPGGLADSFAVGVISFAVSGFLGNLQLPLVMADLEADQNLQHRAIRLPLGRPGLPAAASGRAWWLPPAITLAALMVLGVYSGIMQLLGWDRTLPTDELSERVLDRSYLIALWGVVAMAAAPLAEETLFRGFLFGALPARWGFARAAAISGG